MPRDSACTHRRCGGRPCRQLTDEELTPTEDDLVFAQTLIDEGWYQISAKYRRVARLPADFPRGEDLLRPQFLATRWAKEFLDYWNNHYRRVAVTEYGAAVQTLTTKQFRAFKQLGGPTAL